MSPALPPPTSRVALRPLHQDDVDAMLAVFGDPSVVALDDLEPMSREEIAADLAAPTSPFDVWEGELELAIEHGGEMVGVVTLRIDADAVWLGYHLRTASHGLGLATEAVRAVLPWAVSRFSRPLRAAVHTANRASERVLEKCGFRRVEVRSVQSRGQWVDETVFELVTVSTPT